MKKLIARIAAAVVLASSMVVGLTLPSNAAVPGAPTITAVTPGNGTLSIAFTAASGTGITNYEYSTDGGLTWVTRSPASTATPISITGLSNCSTYPVAIRAVNSDGTGTASESWNGIPSQYQYVLNNGLMRFGTGSEASIGTNGNLRQGWYNSGGSWYKLSFSSYPLNFQLGVGGDGTSEWNTNGSLQEFYSATLARQTIDCSEFVETSNNGTFSTGYGTLTTTGRVTLGGKVIEITRRYTQSATSKYTTFRETIKNVNDTTLSNTRVWVGTQDDWVGTSDGPTKRRGNISNGAFTALSSASTQAKALEVTSGSDAVYFYSTSNLAQISINGCCSFSNSTNQNPATSNITAQNDGSYAMYVRFQDIAPGSSESFTWYYVASTASNAAATLGNVSTAALPSTPTINSVSAGNSQASVNFTAGSAGGSALTNYQYSVDGGSTWLTRSPASTTSPLVISGLTNGSTYNVQLRAVNSEGYGTATTSSTVSPIGPPTAPLVTGISQSDTTIDVAFSAPSSNGGASISNYEYTTDGGTSWTSVNPASTSSPIAISGLTAGTAYAVAIRAVNSVGAGTSSPAQSVTTYSVPSSPTISSATGLDRSASVDINFGANGGTALTNIQYSTDGGTTWVTRNPASTYSPLLISGLTNGTSYQVKVKAVNSVGASSASSAVSVTPRTTPSAPSLSGSVTPSSNTLSLTIAPGSDGGSAITSYKYSTDRGATWLERADGGGSSTAIQISSLSTDGTTPLTNGTEYCIQIRAVNTVGAGAASADICATPKTTPDAPTISSSTSRDRALEIAYALGSNGGALISDVEYCLTSCGTNSSWVSAGTTASPLTIGGLTNGTSYTVSLRAVNSIGNSQTVTGLFAIPANNPSAPTVTGITTSSASASVSFNAPSSDGGLSITNYQYSLDGGTNWTTRSPSSTTSPLDITGLTNGTTYSIQLRAVTASTTGLASTVTYVTPSTTPSAPTSVTFTGLSSRIAVSYTAADSGGSPITTYEYALSTDGGSTYGSWISANTTNTSFTISGLTNGSGYRIKLRAVNANGNGTATASPASNTTPAGVPESPVITATNNAATAPASLTGNQISVSFAEPSNNGSAITNYQYSTDGGATWINRTDGTGRFSPIVISNLSTNGTTALSNGISYPVQIRAVNSNGSGDASASSSVTAGGVVDNTPPTVTITSPSASSNSRTLSYPVSFSESVSGVSTSDLVQASGTATCSTSAVSASSGTSVTFTVVCTSDGTVTMKVPLNSVVDAASNAGPTANIFATEVNVDTTSPSVSVTSPSLTSASRTLTYQVSFSESVSGIGVSDFTQASGSATCSTTAVSATSGTSANFTVACSTDGTVAMRFGANGVADQATNNGPTAAVTSTSTTIDTSIPTAVVTAPAATSHSRTLSYTLTFPENISGLSTSDFEQASGSATCSAGSVSATSGTSIVVTVTCTTDGTVTMQLKSNSVLDDAGNAGPASASAATSLLVDAIPNKVTNVSGTLSGRSLAIAWDASTVGAKSAVTGYRAVLSGSGGELSCSTTALSCSIENLIQGQTYSLAVYASNVQGDSVASDAISIVVPAAQQQSKGSTIPTRFDPTASDLGFSNLSKSVQSALVDSGVVKPPSGTQTLILNTNLANIPAEVSAVFDESRTINPGVAIEQRLVAPSVISDNMAWWGYLFNTDGKWISLGSTPAIAGQEVVLPAMSLVEPGSYKIVSTIKPASGTLIRGFENISFGVMAPRSVVTAPLYGRYTVELTVTVSSSSKKIPVVAAPTNATPSTMPSPSASPTSSAVEPSPSDSPSATSEVIPAPVGTDSPWSDVVGPTDDRGLVVVNPVEDAPELVAETTVTAVTLVSAVTAAAAAAGAVAAAAGAAAGAAASAAGAAAGSASAGASSTSTSSGGSTSGRTSASSSSGASSSSSSSGGSSSSSQSGSGGASSDASSEAEENSDLTEIEYANDGITIERVAWGDGLPAWHNARMTWLDKPSHDATLAIAPFSPLLSRLINDGAYLRAMIGTLSTVLPFISILLGLIGVVANGSVLLPPPAVVMLALAVIGVFDALAGFVGIAIYLAIVSVLAGVHSLGDVRMLVGVAAITFAPTLLAAAFRGLRREKATTPHEWFERAIDLAVAPFLGGWATASMVGALPALAGVVLPIAQHANAIGIAVAIALVLRVAGEEVAAQFFPERLNKIHPDEVPDTSMRQKSIALTFRFVAFLFVAGALIGNSWHLYAGGLLFIIPSVLSLYQDRFPNSPRLFQLLPSGLPGLAFALIVASATLTVLMNALGTTPDLARLAFVLIPIPGFIMSILGMFGREPVAGDVRWYQRENMVWVYRIGGIAVLLYTLRLTGIV